MRGGQNTSQPARSLLVLTALGALLAGCNPTGPKLNADRGQTGAGPGSTAPGELDRERARASLVNVGDLGKGWEAQLADANDSQNPIAQCVQGPGTFSGLTRTGILALELSPAFLFSSAQGNFGTTSVPVVPSSTLVPPPPTTTSSAAAGPTTAGSAPSSSTTSTSTPTATPFPGSGTGWSDVVSYAAVVSTVDMAKLLFSAITVPPLRDCVVSTAESDLHSGVAADATPTGVTVELLPLGQTGDESTANRAVLAVATGGTTVQVNLDLIGIRRGRIAAGLCIISTGAPPPMSDEYDLATRLGHQMAPFGA